MDGKRPIINALVKILKPLAKLLLDMGFSFRDFNEVAKLVYVEVATDAYGLRGRRTNMSRVAILTGLTRREVARLRSVIDSQDTMVITTTNVAGRVLADWFQLPSYIDTHAKPIVIPMTGQNSLTSLVETHRGDIPTTAIIKELQRVGAIEINNNRARVMARHFSPTNIHPRALERIGSIVSDLTQTATNNLRTSSIEAKRFEKQVYQMSIPADLEAEFSEHLDKHASIFLHQINEWLTGHNTGDTSKALKLGAGVYAIMGEEDPCTTNGHEKNSIE